jgi:Ser-tRNA(Ala) deacylase AlaX
MNTVQLYYEDPYLTDSDATIVRVDDATRPRTVEVELDRTIFYPQGGGQPSDQGEITTPTGTVKVNLVRYLGDRIVHEGQVVGNIAKGTPATQVIKWPRRLKYMRLHSAGHLLHDVLTSMVPGLIPIRGNHGDKAALEYQGFVDPSLRDSLSQRLDSEVAMDLPISTREIERDDLIALGVHVPSNLPTNKALRIIQIGEYSPMPDGGVHVRSTAEIGTLVVHSITNADGQVTLRYGVIGRGSE